MGEGGRAGVQRLATEAMEAESRGWMVQCPKCGAERSVWEMGGIRYKAAGSPRWYRRCPGCGKLAWLKVYWKGGVPGAAPASPRFVLRFVLALVFGILLATGAILLVAFKLADVL
jgi:hypothetical protein